MRLEIIHVVAWWVSFSGIGRDPGVFYSTSDMRVGGIEIETLYCSIEVLERAESDFIVARLTVFGVEEERGDIDYGEEEGLSEVEEDGAGECG